MLSDHGLRAAVDELVDRFPIPVTLTDETVLGTRFASTVENCGYFFVSEALTNAMRHSSASSIGIALRTDGSQLLVAVSDDGTGGASPSRGSGLTGLRERAAMLGGSVTIDSPLGGPTTVALSLPTSVHPSSPAA